MIKKWIFGILLIALLSGCEVVEDNADMSIERQDANFQNASNATIVTDTSTGCQYVVIDKQANNAVMSPYINADGKVNGCKNTTSNNP